MNLKENPEALTTFKFTKMDSIMNQYVTDSLHITFSFLRTVYLMEKDVVREEQTYSLSNQSQ
jgi:hypothetical protein